MPTKAVNDARSFEDAPVACTSNGDPPPEFAFESCAFGACDGAAAVEEAGGFTPVGDTAIEVRFGSTISPCDDEVDACAALVEVFNVVVVVIVVAEDDCGGGAAEVVVVLDDVAACVLVCAVVLVLDVEVVELDVTTLTPGHSDVIPRPNWKTPMMLISPTSTPLHALCTSTVISCRPCTHAELQRAVPLKSLAWHPLMVVVYADSHCELGMLLMRGVKLERETVAVLPVMRSATPNATACSDMCIAV